MNKNLFTILYAFRNRDSDRVDRSLNSLKKQKFKDFNVIFVDYGSDIEYSQKVKSVVEKYPFCNYIYTETKGFPWNKCEALNIAIKQVDSEYIFINDIDIILPNDLLFNLQKVINPRQTFFYYYYFLGKDFEDWDNVEIHRDLFKKRDKDTCGVHCVPSQVLKQINGFDEFYCYWGVEDRDIRRRYELMGLKEYWNDNFYQFHQWHTVKNYSTDGYMPLGLWDRLQHHYFINFNKAKRNLDNCGRLYTQKDRITYKYLNFNNNELTNVSDLKFLNLLPYNPESGGTLIQEFYSLPSGKAIAVPDAFFPQKNNFLNSSIKFGNKVLRKLKTNTEVGYRENILHSAIVRIIQEDRNNVLDYYLNFPDKKYNGVSIIIKK